MGVFGADLTNFKTYCYELYEESNTLDRFNGGCQYGAISYYDGFAMGGYMTLPTATDYYELYDAATDFFG